MCVLCRAILGRALGGDGRPALLDVQVRGLTGSPAVSHPCAERERSLGVPWFMTVRPVAHMQHTCIRC